MRPLVSQDRRNSERSYAPTSVRRRSTQTARSLGTRPTTVWYGQRRKSSPSRCSPWGVRPPSPARSCSELGRWSRPTCSVKLVRRREGALALARWLGPSPSPSSRTSAKVKSSASMKSTRPSQACSRNGGSTTVLTSSFKRTYETPPVRRPNSSLILSGGDVSRQLALMSRAPTRPCGNGLILSIRQRATWG